MMPLDTLTCDVTPNSVEPTSLSCSMPPLEHLELWDLFLSNAGVWVTALATIALVIAAIGAGRIALETLKQQQKDSYAAWRPYLTAQVVPSLAGPPNFDLVIENIGASPAVGIEIFSPSFPDEMDKISKNILDLFSIVTFISPGARLRNYWRLEVAKGSTWLDGTNEPIGMPQVATLTVRYQDLEGKKFEDQFLVDTKIYKLAPLPADGPNPKEALSEEQKDLHKMLGTIAVAIGEHRR